MTRKGGHQTREGERVRSPILSVVAPFVDREALVAYLRAVQAARRATPERPGDGDGLAVSVERVRAFRAHASGLDARLPGGSYPQAARGGLQDSAPRDALLALHARVDSVPPDAWEDPSLVQIWFRGADYVVPREDFGVFTLGALPRDETQARALLDLADVMARAIERGAISPHEACAEVADQLPNPFIIRSANVAGRFRIRWDARFVTLHPKAAPAIDAEEARLELARRFLRWLGPATPQRFARWAGVPRSDAVQTFDALSPELSTVSLNGFARSILTDDLHTLLGAEAGATVRFLPQGDPYLQPDPLVLPERPRVEREGVDRRLLNSLANAVLLDGELVASWGRRKNKLTIAAWGPMREPVRARIEEEAIRMQEPIDSPMQVAWL